VLLDVDPATARERFTEAPDRLESEPAEFHARVRAGFLALAAADPARYLVVDAGQEPEAVTTVIRHRLDRMLPLSDAEKKAQEEARRKAEEEARRKAEEEARRKAEEERLERERQEQLARMRAEEEERKRRELEEAQRREAERQAEEARQRAEEARRRAEAERARLLAEEKARAEAEARRKAEEERLRRQAEEEARQRAEAEARRLEKQRKAEEALLRAEEARREAEQAAAAAQAGPRATPPAAAELPQDTEATVPTPVVAPEDAPAGSGDRTAVPPGPDDNRPRDADPEDTSRTGDESASEVTVELPQPPAPADPPGAADETAVLPQMPAAGPADETAVLPPVRGQEPGGVSDTDGSRGADLADRLPPGYFRDERPAPARPDGGEDRTRELPQVDPDTWVRGAGGVRRRPRPEWAEETPLDDLPSLTDELLGPRESGDGREHGAYGAGGRDPRM
jgi:dTMP kinase